MFWNVGTSVAAIATIFASLSSSARIRVPIVPDASRTAAIDSNAASSSPALFFVSTAPVIPDEGTSPTEALNAASSESDCALRASASAFCASASSRAVLAAAASPAAAADCARWDSSRPFCASMICFCRSSSCFCFVSRSICFWKSSAVAGGSCAMVGSPLVRASVKVATNVMAASRISALPRTDSGVGGQRSHLARVSRTVRRRGAALRPRETDLLEITQWPRN